MLEEFYNWLTNALQDSPWTLGALLVATVTFAAMECVRIVESLYEGDPDDDSDDDSDDDDYAWKRFEA